MSVTEGSFSTGYVTYDNKSDRLTLRWSRTATSGSTSTIKVEIVLNGESTMRTITNTSYTFTMTKGTIAKKSGSGTMSGNKYTTDIGGSYYSGTGTVIDTSYFTITHDNGEGIFSLALIGYIGGVQVSQSGGSYELPVTTTACTRPTDVSASGYVAPSGSFEVSWEGAAGGTANAIVGYTIYWRITSDGSAPTTKTYTGFITVDSTSTAGTATITISSATRGRTVVCGVVTRGSAGENFYSPIRTGGSVIVNTLPSVPTLSQSTATINAYTNSATVTPTAGNTNDTGQTGLVRYSTNNETPTTSNTIECTSGQSFTATLNAAETTKTWYFYTYDGCEFSAAKTFKVTRTKTPTTSYSATVTNYNALGTTTTYTKQISLAMTWTNLSTNYTNKSYYKVYYTTNGDTPTPSSSSYTQPTPVSVVASGNNTTTRTLNLVSRNWISAAGIKTNNKIRFKVYMYINNGYETSIEYTDGNTYEYAAAPSVTFHNKHNGTDESDESLANYFCQKISFTFQPDAEYKGYTINMILNSSVVETFQGTNSNGTINLTLDSTQLSNDSNYTFQIIFSNNDSSHPLTRNSIAVATKKALAGPILTNFTTGNAVKTVKPYTVTASSISSLVKINSSLGTYAALVSEFKISSVGLKLSRSSYTESLSITPSSFADGTLMFGINPQSLFSFTGSYLGISSYNGTYSYNLSFVLTNSFGVVYTSNAITCTFNFNEAPKTATLASIEWSSSSSGTYDSNFTNIEEGMYLNFNIKAELYTTEIVNVQLEISRDNGSTWSQIGSGTLEKDTNTSTAVEKTNNIVYGPIGEITDTIARKFRIIVTGAGGSTISTAVSKNVQKWTSPSIVFNTCTYDSPNFNYNFTTVDSGEGTLQKFLSDGTTNYTNALVSDSGEAASIMQTYWESASLMVKVISTRPTGKMPTAAKTYYSNVIVVYTAQPTVSYRKNHLGINTKDLESDAIIEIHTAQGRDKIYVVNVTDSTIMAIISASGGVLGGGSTII